MIESYMRRTSQLRGIVLLLDIRRDPSEDDRAMLDFLAAVEVPTLVAVTKTDKLSKSAARTRVSDLTKMLSLESEQVIPFSAISGEGRTELLEAIMDLVSAAPAADAS